MRRAASRAGPKMQTPAALLPSEVELSTDIRLRPELTEVMHVRPLRDGKLMASEGCLCTEDRECLRGFPGSATTELAITGVFS